MKKISNENYFKKYKYDCNFFFFQKHLIVHFHYHPLSFFYNNWIIFSTENSVFDHLMVPTTKSLHLPLLKRSHVEQVSDRFRKKWVKRRIADGNGYSVLEDAKVDICEFQDGAKCSGTSGKLTKMSLKEKQIKRFIY